MPAYGRRTAGSVISAAPRLRVETVTVKSQNRYAQVFS